MIPVHFVLPRGIVLLDVAGPAEAFRVANKLCPDAFAQHFCGPSTEIESGIPGLHLARIQPLPEKLPPEALVIVSGVVGKHIRLDEPEARLIIDWLAQRHPADGFTLMTVCAGALFAAAAGLTRQRECTTHHSCLAQLADLDPSARLHDNRIFVEDGNLVSSAGITAGIDLALAMVEADLGAELAAATAREMVVYHRRSGGQSQFSALQDLAPDSERMRAVLEHIRANLGAALTVEHLAEVACVSPRQFLRSFKADTGETPAKAVERIRAEAARACIEAGDDSIDSVARRVGFMDSERMRRAFLRVYGQPPQALRRAARNAALA